MLYALINSNNVIEYPLSIPLLKKRYKSTSFPFEFEEFDYTAFGVVKIEGVPQPSCDLERERIIEKTPIKIQNEWKQQWVIEPLSPDEQQQILDGKANAIRAERDRKLAESDWRIIYETEKAATDGLGIQYPVAWSEYRQALRDIPQQPGFPTNVTWPDLPQ